MSHIVPKKFPNLVGSGGMIEPFLAMLDAYNFTFTGHGVFSHPGFRREKAKSRNKRKNNNKRADTRKQPRFPDALYLALQDNSISDVISWTENGKSVWVKDKDRLVTEVYPKHFQWMVKMQDFYNGLCNYNFKAESRGAGKYSNPDFRRDSPNLVVKSKNSSAAKRRAAEQVRKHEAEMKSVYAMAGIKVNKPPFIVQHQNNNGKV